MYRIALLSLTLAAASGSALALQSPQAVAKSGPQEFLPAPTEVPALTTSGDSVLRLEALVRAYEASSGITFVMTNDTAQLLAQSSAGIVALPQMKVEDFPYLLQTLLRSQDFVLSYLSTPDLGLVQLQSLRTNVRTTVRQFAHKVEAGDHATMARNPAFLMSTVVSMPHVDVRQLANSMRTLITDGNVQAMVPAGSTNQLVLTGFGDWLSDLVPRLESIEEATALEGQQDEERIELWTHRLQYIGAPNFVRILREIYGPRTNEGGAVVPSHMRWSFDEHTNSVIVHGPARLVGEVQGLVAKLDIEVKK